MDFKPKLMAFDLDGTLAESKARVSPQMGEHLATLMQKMPVAVMSGGSYAQFENQLLPSIPDDAHLEHLYLFPTNAARCYAYKNNAWQLEYDRSINDADAKRIMDAFHDAIVETGFVQPTQLWGEQLENRGSQISFSALGQQAPVEEKKKWDPTREKRKPLYEALLKKLPDFSIGLNATTSIDVTHKGINKAYGIRQLVKLTGISVSEILYVGDALQEGGNDYVVVETGVRTHEVFGPEETQKVIEAVLAQYLEAVQ